MHDDVCVVTESLVLFLASFRWYPLTCKPGKNKSGYRGDIELSIGFSVNSHHEAKSERRVSQVMSYSETQSSAKISSWSDNDNDNDDPGVVSEIEDEMLEEIGPVTPVLTPTHSTEDILDMFDKTGERCVMQQET